MTVAAVIEGCSAALFAVGLVAILGVGATVAGEGWGDWREKQAALHQAQRSCGASPYDPTEWGTSAQQVESCIADRMDTYIGFGEVHPIFVIGAGIAVFYLAVTGLAAWAARDYQTRRRTGTRRPAGSWAPSGWTTAVTEGELRRIIRDGPGRTSRGERGTTDRSAWGAPP
jgi:hypothetical protein